MSFFDALKRFRIFTNKFDRSGKIKTSAEARLSRKQLGELSKDELVKKVWNLEGRYQSLSKDAPPNISKYSKMMTGFGAPKKRRRRRRSKINHRPCASSDSYRNIALKVAYLGWDFHGLQSNPNMEDTIENILKGALTKTGLIDPSDPVKIGRCGRTDKGVSSFDQVITLCVRSKLDVNVHQDVKSFDDLMEKSVLESKRNYTKYKGANDEKICADLRLKSSIEADLQNNQEYDYPCYLNSVLPTEVQVLAWAPLDDFRFSARYDCKSRDYRYYFPKQKFNIDLMRKSAKLFCGEHDFRNFAKVNPAEKQTFVRIIYSFEITESTSEDFCCAEIKGSAFVHNQVRNMMSVLFLVGMEKEDPSVISYLLDVDRCPGKPLYPLVSGYPLTLFKTSFTQDLKWQTSTVASLHLLTQLEYYSSDLSVKSTLVKELLKKIEGVQESRLIKSPSYQLVKSDLLNHTSTSSELFKTLHLIPEHSGVFNYLTERSSNSNEPYQALLQRSRRKTPEQMQKEFHQKQLIK